MALSSQPTTQTPSQVAVVMVPFPGHSHLNQLLQLSYTLATSYGIPVHYTATTTHIHEAELRYQNTNNLIHFHDMKILLPTPSPNDTTDSYLENHILPAIAKFRQPVFRLVQELSKNVTRVVVFNDALMGSVVQDVKAIPNAEAYTFHPVSAFNHFFAFWEYMPVEYRPFRLDSDDEAIANAGYADVPSNNETVSPVFREFLDNGYRLSASIESGRVYNTSRLIEGKYVQLLEKLTSKAHFAIGPLNLLDDHDQLVLLKVESSRHPCLEWLDKQEKDSVMYVSFGTTTLMSDEQIQELAMGLETSGNKFLWVLPYGADQLGCNEDGVRGMVVRDWAPQVEILAHPSIGGFMSHCGWGSCLESISMGVPMAAWPMTWDQPRNSVLLTRVLQIGVLVRDWARRGELVKASAITDVVKRLLATDEGVEMRKRSKALASAVRESLAHHGGASRLEMESLVSRILGGDSNKPEKN